MQTRTAEALLALALGLRGTSLLFSKIVLMEVGPLTLIGIRFLISFAILGIIFNKKLRTVTGKEIFHAFIVGFCFFITMFFELYGLKTTPASTTAFIENSAVVIIPIWHAIIFKKFPSKITIVSALIAMVGIALLTLKGSHISLSKGEFFVLISAISYSATVISIDTFTADDDSFNVGVFHLFFIGLLGIIFSFIFENPGLPTSKLSIISLLYLAIICSGLGFTLQPIAQKYISADRAGLFTALNPLSAMILGVIFLNERLSASGIIGAFLILSSIFIPSAANTGLLNKFKK